MSAAVPLYLVRSLSNCVLFKAIEISLCLLFGVENLTQGSFQRKAIQARVLVLMWLGMQLALM